MCVLGVFGFWFCGLDYLGDGFGCCVVVVYDWFCEFGFDDLGGLFGYWDVVDVG